MSHTLRRFAQNIVPFAALLVAASALALAGPAAAPEPSDYALGFGGVTLGLVVWRNRRKAREAKLRR